MTARAGTGGTSMQIATVLGQRTAALRFDDLPPEALHWAKVGLLDTIGVTLAGAAEPAPQRAANTLPYAMRSRKLPSGSS